MLRRLKKSVVDLSMDAMMDLCGYVLRTPRREDSRGRAQLKETRAAIDRLPAVRRKRREERVSLAAIWVATLAVFAVVALVLGWFAASAVVIAGLVSSVFLSRLMRISDEAAPDGGDPGVLSDIVASVILARRLEEVVVPETEEEEGLLVERGMAPAVWDASRWLSAKTGLPVPRIRIVEDPKVVAYIEPWGSGAQIVIDRRTLAFISGRRKTARTRTLLAHEYAHWIENDWRRTGLYRLSVGLLCGIALAALAAFVVGGLTSWAWHGIDLRLCLEGAMSAVIATLFAVSFGTIGYARQGLLKEYAADAVAAHLVGSRKKAADFFLDGVKEWVGGPYEEYCPFRYLMHPPMKARARAIMNDS